MAIPTSYTEFTLKTFMHEELHEVATALGWTVVAGHYDEAVIETLLTYGVSDIALATNMRKLRSLARREVWRAVVAATAGDYDFSDNGTSYSRSQINAQARKALADAERDASRYDAGGGYVIAISKTHYADPYQRLTTTEREVIAEVGRDLS